MKNNVQKVIKGLQAELRLIRSGERYDVLVGAINLIESQDVRIAELEARFSDTLPALPQEQQREKVA